MKKTDLMRAIEQFDAKIATHQQEIDSLTAAKTILEGVAREKSLKKTKKSPAVTAKRGPRAQRTTHVDASGTQTAASLLDGQ
ncbi:hypothetical protein D4R30_00570 [archaeon]|nr:MAG: hypothetical protein D4R30_00570 [archaeon]